MDIQQKYNELVEQYEAVKNRADNLNLYIDYFRQMCEMKGDGLFEQAWDEFDGLPGYEKEPTYVPWYRREVENVD